MNLFRKLFFWKWTDDEVLAKAQKALKHSRFVIAIIALLAVIGIGFYWYLLFALTDVAKIEGDRTGADFQMGMITGFFLGVFAMSLFVFPLAAITLTIYEVRVSKLLLKLRDRVRELEARPAHRD